jgi:ABC-type maltose transport system permease subunit
MGRKKKNTFIQSKMIASRVEASDYHKLDVALSQQHKTLQDLINTFVVQFVSGNLYFSGTLLVSK